MFHRHKKTIFLCLLACSSLSHAMYQRPPGNMFKSTADLALAIKEFQKRNGGSDNQAGLGYLGGAAGMACISMAMAHIKSHVGDAGDFIFVVACCATVILMLRGIHLLTRNSDHGAAKQVAADTCPCCLAKILLDQNEESALNSDMIDGITFALDGGGRTGPCYGNFCTSHAPSSDNVFAPQTK